MVCVSQVSGVHGQWALCPASIVYCRRVFFTFQCLQLHAIGYQCIWCMMSGFVCVLQTSICHSSWFAITCDWPSMHMMHDVRLHSCIADKYSLFSMVCNSYVFVGCAQWGVMSGFICVLRTSICHSPRHFKFLSIVLFDLDWSLVCWFKLMFCYRQSFRAICELDQHQHSSVMILFRLGHFSFFSIHWWVPSIHILGHGFSYVTRCAFFSRGADMKL